MELDRIERECEITKRRMERRFPLDTYQAAVSIRDLSEKITTAIHNQEINLRK